MTAPQVRAAKTVKYLPSEGIGRTGEGEVLYGWFNRGRKEAKTLETTYNTI